MQVFPNVTITDPGDPTEIAPRTVLPAQLKPMLEPPLPSLPDPLDEKPVTVLGDLTLTAPPRISESTTPISMLSYQLVLFCI